MKTIIKTTFFTAGTILGLYIGTNMRTTQTETENYKIITQNEQHYLMNKEQDKTHEIHQIKKETYLGTTNHMTQSIIKYKMHQIQNEAKK